MKTILLILIITELVRSSVGLFAKIKYKDELEEQFESTKEIVSTDFLLTTLIISFLPPILIYVIVLGTIKNTFILYLTLIMTCKALFAFINCYRLTKKQLYKDTRSKLEIIVNTILNMSYDMVILVYILFNA